MTNPPPASQSDSTRRSFLKTTTTAALAGTVASQLDIARGAHAEGKEVFRVGLVGCGGRGTGAAAQALRADKGTQLVAMADAFDDQIDRSLTNLSKSDVKDRIAVDKDRQFAGLDGYQRLIDSGVDIVLLATPPHFRPQHLKACVDANKHVFVEKPVATDPTGIRSVMETCELAKKKNLSIVSGLCWRYETGMQQMVEKLHSGAIGEIITCESVRYLGGVSKMALREEGWTDLEYQLRNWYYHTWLSGDFNVEQFVHEMDKLSWIIGQYPTQCTSTGGRQTRTGAEYGNVYDHFATVFEYENGVRYYATTRHQRGCSNPFYDHVYGTKGQANLMKYTITGENPWRRREKRTVMHQLEHDAMYAALRKGETINNGDYMSKSTLVGIMARMSAYTGKTVTWEQAMNSKLDLSPPSYDWNQKLPMRPVALPGVTPLV